MRKQRSILRKAICCIAASIILLGIYQPVHANETIRVGFFAFDGYHNMDDEGHRSGYGYEFIQMMMRYNNYTAEYVGYDQNWSKMQEMLENGEIDILTSAQKTPEREQKFDFSEQIGTSAAILTIKAGDERYSAGEYDTYDGMRVGVIDGNSRNAQFEAFAQEKGFSYTLVYYDGMADLTNDLQSGEHIDAIVTSNLRSVYNEWILDKFAVSPFYAMVRKGNTDLLDKVNYAIEQMDTNSVGWQDELHDKYYAGNNGESIALSSTERKYLSGLKSRGETIRVIVNPDRAPYSYVENGEMKGIIPAVFAEVANRLDLPYEMVECSTREEYQQKVASGDINIVIDGRYDWSAAEDAGYKLTDSYLDLSYAAVERSDFSGEVKSVAVLKYADTSEENLRKFMDGKKVIYCDTMNECVNAVMDGKVDVSYLYDYCGQKYVTENASGVLQSTTLPDMKDSLSLGVYATDDYRLLAILNKGIASVSANYVDTAIKENTDFSVGNLSLHEFLNRNPLIMSGMVALMAAFVVLIVYSYQKKVTERKLQEQNQELERTKDSLKDALAAANQASASKGSFLSNMSHEIRTPLNAIIGYLSLARDNDIQDEKLAHSIENCEIASKHLLQIINDILDMSSIESGKLKIAHEDFDLKKEITDITTIFFQNARQKGVSFETRIENLTEEWVVGDQLRLNQILMNLLSNAVKFTPEKGTVLLKISQISDDEKKVYVQFQVSDTGIGMSEEYMSRIFRPFEQENAGTAKKFGGSGLGLSITNNLAQMMGGKITVKSKQNEGTTFTVTMYFDKCTKAHARLTPPADYSHVRVLVVDDQKDECTYIKTMLKRCGVKADFVTDGNSALRKVKSRMGGDYEYDLCIIDWNMPEMNGCEVTRRIRAEFGTNIPIIIATAYDISEFHDEAMEAGVNKIVAKPLFQSTMFDLLVNTFGEYDPSASRKESTGRLDLTGVHVLLAEDNAMNMEIATAMLEKTGIKVDQAMNGEQACSIFLAKEPGTYDLILMDVQMPVMDGYEATRVIRNSEHPEATTIPIIAMTANAFAEDVAEALSKGMNAHIAKPINHDKLFEVLQNYRKD